VTLGERLRELRVSGPGGYRPLRQMAKEAGCSFVEWSHFENNRERPTPEFVVAVAMMLGANPGELLRLLDEWQEAPPPDLSRSICNGRRLQP
jgi:transcriptional regulator with XRE-family HTH domain